jgi:putative ABC transport system substrate-binding protein
MRRRDFIALLGAAATPALRPLAARAQQEGRAKRVGFLVARLDDGGGADARVTAMRESLARLGWIEGRNLRVDYRPATGDPDRLHALAVELVSLAPDVMVTTASTTRAVLEQTQTIPIVIAQGGDPVASGLVRNIARPEGNITGFSTLEPATAGKWLALLKEAAPHLTRVAVLFIPEFGPTVPSYLASIDAAALALGVQVVSRPYRNAIDTVRAIDAFAAEPNGGLLLLAPGTGAVETIIPLAQEHRLPAIYPLRDHVVAGGLMCYVGGDPDQYARAASYIDRLLRGTKVADLPYQFPTNYELVINLKAAKAIGLTIPPQLLLRANKLIE